LRKAKTADRFALLQEREPFVFLRIAAEGVDRIHDERALDGNEAAEAGVAALEFLRHQAVGHVGHAGATVTVKVCAKKTELTELRNEMLWKLRLAALFFNDGNDFVFDEFARRLAH